MKKTKINKTIGNKLKEIRLSRGMSQTQLGNALKISFQQIQKYEKGVNKVSCVKLIKFSEVMEFNPGEFINLCFKSKNKEIKGFGKDILFFVRKFHRIKSEKNKKLFIDIMSSLASILNKSDK